MIRFWPVGSLVTVAALLGAALVAYAQLGDSETAGGTIDAAVGTALPTASPTAAPTPTPSPVPTPAPGFDAAVWAGTATAPPNSQVTVDLTVSVALASTVGVLEVTVSYDNAVVGATGCQATAAGGVGVCLSDFSPSAVKFTLVSLQGFSGDVGDITFNTFSTETTTPLAVAIQTCANTLGDNLVCSAHHGSITITSATPTPIPTQAPTPTPRPYVQGDVDCTGGATPVSAVDALKVLRFVAGLPVTQTEPCEDIGSGGPPVQGNVDCSTVGNAVSAVDALKILRFVAGLPVSQQQGCRPLGT